MVCSSHAHLLGFLLSLLPHRNASRLQKTWPSSIAAVASSAECMHAPDRTRQIILDFVCGIHGLPSKFQVLKGMLTHIMQDPRVLYSAFFHLTSTTSSVVSVAFLQITKAVIGNISRISPRSLSSWWPWHNSWCLVYKLWWWYTYYTGNPHNLLLPCIMDDLQSVVASTALTFVLISVSTYTTDETSSWGPWIQRPAFGLYSSESGSSSLHRCWSVIPQMSPLTYWAWETRCILWVLHGLNPSARSAQTMTWTRSLGWRCVSWMKWYQYSCSVVALTGIQLPCWNFPFNDLCREGCFHLDPLEFDRSSTFQAGSHWNII